MKVFTLLPPAYGEAMFSDPVLYVAIGALGSLASAGFLWWYTALTGRLLKVQKSANDPFVFLTFEVDPTRERGALYVRNSGGTPALDIVVMVDDSKVPRADQLRRLYRCDLLSPRVGQHLLSTVKLETLRDGQRFLIECRNVAGERCRAPAAMIFDRALDTHFRWDFPERFPWGDEKR
jgi:hypothetical protein